MEITEAQVEQVNRTVARNEVLSLKVSLMQAINTWINDYDCKVDIADKERNLDRFWHGVRLFFLLCPSNLHTLSH